MPSQRPVTYAQALAVWRHRLDPNRPANLARIAQVANATARLHPLTDQPRDCAQTKQDPAGIAVPAGSTDRYDSGKSHGGCSGKCD